MSAHTSILCREEREWVEAWIAGELHVEKNPDLVRRVLERMWAELEAWHKMAWLWADLRIGESAVREPC